MVVVISGCSELCVLSPSPSLLLEGVLEVPVGTVAWATLALDAEAKDGGGCGGLRWVVGDDDLVRVVGLAMFRMASRMAAAAS